MIDEDDWESDKFDECHQCRNRFEFDICDGCTVGEEFEPDDMEEVDAHFKGRI